MSNAFDQEAFELSYKNEIEQIEDNMRREHAQSRTGRQSPPEEFESLKKSIIEQVFLRATEGLKPSQFPSIPRRLADNYFISCNALLLPLVQAYEDDTSIERMVAIGRIIGESRISLDQLSAVEEIRNRGEFTRHVMRERKPMLLAELFWMRHLFLFLNIDAPQLQEVAEHLLVPVPSLNNVDFHMTVDEATPHHHSVYDVVANHYSKLRIIIDDLRM